MAAAAAVVFAAAFTYYSIDITAFQGIRISPRSTPSRASAVGKSNGNAATCPQWMRNYMSTSFRRVPLRPQMAVVIVMTTGHILANENDDHVTTTVGKIRKAISKGLEGHIGQPIYRSSVTIKLAVTKRNEALTFAAAIRPAHQPINWLRSNRLQQ